MHASRRVIQAAFLVLLPAAYGPAAFAQQTPGQQIPNAQSPNPTQNPSRVPERLVGPGNGHDQPTRQETNTRLRQDNAAPTPQQRQDQLRTLDQLNQELMPGSKPPAPGVEPGR